MALVREVHWPSCSTQSGLLLILFVSFCLLFQEWTPFTEPLHRIQQPIDAEIMSELDIGAELMDRGAHS